MRDREKTNRKINRPIQTDGREHIVETDIQRETGGLIPPNRRDYMKVQLILHDEGFIVKDKRHGRLFGL